MERRVGCLSLKPSSPAMGTFLRVAQWNMERGLEFDAVRLPFSDARGLNSLMEDKGSKADDSERSRIRQRVSVLHDAEVIVLHDVDWGDEPHALSQITGTTPMLSIGSRLISPAL
jgi:hypothetical protein